MGVYVHYPFCSARCPYCDFAIDTRSEPPHARYADAVVAELAARKRSFHTKSNPARLASIYLGGGTPGLWPAPFVGRVVDAICEAFSVSNAGGLEITLEANPGDLKPQNLEALQDAGVNRLSLGVQSFQDTFLEALGRNHTGATAIKTIRQAHAAGLDNLSCDLMFGLPEQTLSDWQRDLDQLIALQPTHVSCYGLTIERGTPFFNEVRAGRLLEPSDELQASCYANAQQRLSEAGYEQYEISSYARPGRRAVHNHLYWTLGAYLGLGCSASSFRPLQSGSGVRFRNPRATETYLRAAERGFGAVDPVFVEVQSPADLEVEALWLGLRTSDGVDRASHRARYGQDPLDVAQRAVVAPALVEAGWLFVGQERLILTPQGFLFADEVAARLCF